MKTPKLLLVILDGGSARAVEAARTPFLDSLRGEPGFAWMKAKAPVPTITYGNHSTILTGRRAGGPGGHGIVGNLFRDPASGKVLNLDDCGLDAFVEARTVFELLNGNSARAVVCATSGEPVTRGAGSVDPMMPILARPVFERDRAAADGAMRWMRGAAPDLVVVNFLSVDGAGENFGPESGEYARSIETADGLIGEMMECWRKEAGCEIHLLVTADHGMTRVERRTDAGQLLARNGVPAAVAASHRAAHVYAEGGAAGDAADVLRESGMFSDVMTRDEYGVFGMDHPRAGDVFALAGPGVELQKDGLRGSHGGNLPEETEVPLIFHGSRWNEILCRRSGFEKSAALEDVSPLVMELFEDGD